jgi:hypothetical protein
VLLAVYALKFAWLLIHLVNAGLIYLIASSLGIDAGFALFVFACNPLVVIELVGNGHNDGLLVLFGLLAIRMLQRGRERGATWVSVLGALVKMPGLFWVAAVVAVLVRRQHWRVLWQSLAAGAITAMTILWLASGSAAALLMDSQWQNSEDSLHTSLIDAIMALAASLGAPVEYEDIFGVDRLVCVTLFVGICGWRYARVDNIVSLIRELGRLMLVLLLAFAVSVYPWYISWVVPFAALTDSRRLRRSILTASGAFLALYAVPYGLLELAPQHALWSVLRRGAAFGVPLAVWAAYEIRRSRRNSGCSGS